jgi:tetratricopeptide (TPR) repeat protein
MSSPHGQLPDFDALWDDDWNFERPAETEQAFLAILLRSAKDAPAAYRLEVLTQIARTQGLQRRFDAAHATLDQVQAALDDLDRPADDRPAPEHEALTPRVRYLLERGRVFNSAGEPARARPLFLAAWELATAAGAAGQDRYAVDAAHMLGIVEPAEQGLAWNRRALALAGGSDDPRARSWRGALYNNMGWTYHAAGAYAQALALFEAALVAWQEDGQTHLIALARWAIARTLRSLGRPQEALARQMARLQELQEGEKGQEEEEEEGARAGTSDGYVHEEIGECLLALGREEEARPHFARAWAVLSQNSWLAATEPERLERLRTLGAVGEGM